jgi:hypothetical protein
MSATEAADSVEDRASARAKRPRSAVTSGRKLFVEGNPNSAWARRFHDLVQGHVNDCGGRSAMGEGRYSLCKRAAGLECEIEQLEGRMSRGEPVDLDAYGRASSHLRRILEVLTAPSLDRKARDVTPDDDADFARIFAEVEAEDTEEVTTP